MGIYDRDWWGDKPPKGRAKRTQPDRGGIVAFGWFVAALVLSSLAVIAYRL